MSKNERRLLWSSILGNASMILGLVFIYSYPIPEAVLYQYQPFTLTLIVGWFNIGLTFLSLVLLALALRKRTP